MTIKQSTGLRNNLSGSTGFAATFANGIIEIRSGPQPATADSAATGTLLGTVTLNGGAFTPGVATNGLTLGAPANGTVERAGTWKFTGLANGVPGWFRFKGNALDNDMVSTTLPRLDGAIASSGGDMQIANLSIELGVENTVDVFRYTTPAQ
jgi:hypothetical protein